MGRRSSYLALRYEGCRQAPIGIETAVEAVRVCGLLDLVKLEKSGVGSSNSRLEEIAARRARLSPRYAARTLRPRGLPVYAGQLYDESAGVRWVGSHSFERPARYKARGFYWHSVIW